MGSGAIKYMYEVEIKVELTAKEREDLVAKFKAHGFTFKGITPQNDYYIEAKKSPYGGYDLKRYRKEAEKYIFTQKVWDTAGGQPARQENEHEVSKEEYESAVKQFPEATKVIKNREWFDAVFKDKKMSVTIDTTKFDHSPAPDILSRLRSM